MSTQTALAVYQAYPTLSFLGWHFGWMPIAFHVASTVRQYRV